MPNRLANADSPYLKQHQDNPVDWFPWGDEAFARAKAENKPIFLSVGYSSCHWCHVMAHESFEADDVAEILNKHFISIKVDREERPDVDEAYMTAVQLYSGRGGWPMSVFLTSDGKPIFAGTYFPKESRGQYPGFKQIATQLATMWGGQRGQVEEAAEKFTEALRQTLGRSAPATFTKLDQAFVDGMVKKLLADFDPEHGGFGQAPKFPPHSAIELLMAYVMSEQADPELAQATFGAAVGTLQRMALGGVHDHVGGGFHRYSTDREWLLPHFEKMLYDNALLLGNYARAAALLGEMAPPIAQFFSGVAGGIAMWMQREMLGPDGLFFSALDADSEGEEGKFYTWTVSEVKELLGPEADAFLEAYGFSLGGNFKDEATRELTGQNIPHLDRDAGGQFDDSLDKLLAARSRRVRPGTDDKALVGWNGLALAGMAEAGMAHLAEVVALALLKAEATFGELPHQVVRGNPSGIAFLEDYAYVADGLFMLARAMQALHEFGGEGLPPFQHLPTFYREHAERLTKTMVERFYDEANGGFFSTSAQHEPLFGRTKPVFDQPSPSANSRALRCLAEIGDARRITQTQEHLIGWVEQAPGATEALLTVFLPYAASAPVEQVVVKPTTPPTMRVEPREIQASGGKGVTRVIIDVPEGLHLNSPTPPARWLEPTKVTLNGIKGEIRYPEATNDQYVGQVVIEVEVELPTGRKDAEFELQIAYQSCTDRECLEPVRKNVGCVIFA